MKRLGRHIGIAFGGVALGVGAFLFVVAPLNGAPLVHAATSGPISCQTAAEKAACQAQYDQLQTEIASWQKIIDDTKNKEKNLQGDVTVLNAQIAKAQAEIN